LAECGLHAPFRLKLAFLSPLRFHVASSRPKECRFMRLKLALIGFTALTAAAIALPASAQSYRGDYGYDDGCAIQRKNNTAAGAVLGAVIGGVLGSNIAAHGHRGDGTAVGAGLGALAGGAAGNNTNCTLPPPPPPGYGPAPYPDELAGGPGDDYPPEARVYDDRGRDPARLRHRHSRLYAGDTDTYKYQDDFAGRDCTTVSQVTRLPDGSSIKKPVEVCREARYGDWEVQN
jgi:hypothetical protein